MPETYTFYLPKVILGAVCHTVGLEHWCCKWMVDRAG